MATWADIQRGIFAGESGGDYGALYGYANRPDGLFSDVRLPEMTVSQVMDFTDPRGEYAQYVSSLNDGVVATPVGAYQVVGSTLRDAARGLGLTGSEKFDQATQDRIGQWIYQNQGTGAWEGYQGPQAGGQEMPVLPQQNRPQGILEMMGVQKQGQGPQGDVPFYQRDRFKDFAGRVAMAANELRQRPSQNLPQVVLGAQQQRKANRTAEWLASQPNGQVYAEMIMADPSVAASALMEWRKSQAGPAYRQVTGADIGLTGPQAGMLFNVGADGKITQVGGGGTTINMGEMSEADKQRLKYQMDVMIPLAQEGVNAKSALGQTQTLEALLGQTETGFGAGLASWAKNTLGINVADDAAVAAEAIISQLVPAQRPAGSGTMSDADLALYKASLPRLSNTPEGNQIIIDGMKAMAQYKMAMGDIAGKFSAGIIRYEDALAEMNALADPMGDVVARIKAGGYDKGAAEATEEIVVDSSGGKWRYKGSGSREDQSNYERVE